jgi:hypothetical protein
MSAQFYNLLHLFGIFLLLTALAGVSIYAANGGSRQTSQTRRLSAILHGVGALLILVSGFGMLAKLGGTSGLPGWVVAKLVIWLLLGGLIMLPYHKPGSGRIVALAVPLLALIAAWLALYKPF